MNITQLTADHFFWLAAMEEFFGKQNMDALRKFVNDRSDVTSLCNSLLPKNSIPSVGGALPG